MSRVLLLLPSATYRAPDFLAAARALEVEVVVGSEHRQTLAGLMGDRAVVLPLADPVAAVAAVADLHARSPLDAVVAVDDQGLAVAAEAAALLGLPHNPAGAVAATRDKSLARRRLAAAGVRQPDFEVLEPTLLRRPDAPEVIAKRAGRLGFPCVLKPARRSASQGVVRADDPTAMARVAVRVLAIVGDGDEPLLLERFVPGAEVAVEGLLESGAFTTLAVFDKPDPLDGPFFEETLFVTPSRLPPAVRDALGATAAEAAAALGLVEGPVHAELRVADDGTVTALELAGRSIGGLCARTLRFGAGVSLEELILRHALGLGTRGLVREAGASGVMMLPIAGAGRLVEVAGQEEARAVPGIVGLEVSIAPGRPVVPLPEGDRYLGFLFARGDSPEAVESSLRTAHAHLRVQLA